MFYNHVTVSIHPRTQSFPDAFLTFCAGEGIEGSEGGGEEDVEEACDSNEIPFTAASDLSLSPNGESRRKRRRRDGKKEEAWKEGQSVAPVASIVK